MRKHKSFWATKKIRKPTIVRFRRSDGTIPSKYKKEKECRHRWRVGSFIGHVIKKQIRKIGIHIWCEKCGKKIQAYYKRK